MRTRLPVFLSFLALLLASPLSAMPDGGALLGLSPAPPVVERVVGAGGIGPYPLAAPAVWGSEAVWVAGQPAREGEQYLLDHGRGLLYFPRGLPRGMIAVIAYRPAVLAAPAADAHPPAEKPARRWGVARYLELRLGAPAPETNGPPALLLAEEKWPSAALPDLNETRYGSMPPSPLLRRLANRDAGGTSLPPLTGELAPHPGLPAAVQDHFRHGERFGATQAYLSVETQSLWQDGQHAHNDVLALSILSEPSPGWEFRGQLQQRDSTYGGLFAGQDLTLIRELGRGSFLESRFGYQESDRFGEAVSGGLNFTTAFGAASQASVGWTHVQSDFHGAANQVNLDATALLTERLQFQGNVFQRHTERDGRLTSASGAVAFQPLDPVQIEASYLSFDGDRDGLREERFARLTVAPSHSLSGQITVNEVDAQLDGFARAMRWSLQAGHERYLRVEGGEYDRQLRDGSGALDTGFRVEASPLHALRLRYSETERDYATTDQDERQREARLELEPAHSLLLFGQVREIQDSWEDYTLAGLGGRAQLGSLFDLEAHARRQFRPDEEPLNGTELRVGVTPVPRVRLFGGVASRPQDDFGGLRDENHRTVGLDLSVGALSLIGSVARVDVPLTEATGEEAGVELRLRLDPRSSLVGGFRQWEFDDLSLFRMQSYRLGFRRSMGQSFFMHVEGEWTRYMDTAMPGQELFGRANARFGIRF